MTIDWQASDRWIMGEAWVGSRIQEHLGVLTDDFAPRWAGSEGERRTVDYIVGQWESLGLDAARSEPFDLNTWDPGTADLRIEGDERWTVDARPALSCPPVKVAGVLVNAGYGMPHELKPLSASLRGAVVVCDSGPEPFSPLMTFPERVRALANAGVVAIITPNGRLAPRFTAYMSADDWRNGQEERMPVPVVQTSREDGARLIRRAAGGARATLDVRTSFIKGQSANTVAELPGDRWPDEHLVLGAHHDTVPTSFGADDNGSGTVVVLEVARTLALLRRERGVTPGRTIRFVTFGAEEQVLQGSMAYVERHHGSEPTPRLMINLDQLGTGNMKGVALQFPELRPLVQQELDSMHDGLRCHVIAQLDSSGDMYAFSLAAIPSAILWRWRFVGPYPETAFGHSSADTMDKVRVRDLKEYAGLLARLMLRLSHVPPGAWPENRLDRNQIAARVDDELGKPFRTR